MKCKKCDFDLEVFQSFESCDILAGEWKGKVFHVVETKDTGSYEMTAEYLMCPDGHVSQESYELEW